MSVSPQNIAQNIAQNVDRIAAGISVKIVAGEFLGSGFIVQRDREKYIVVTNQHVLRAGEAPYSIETSDGRVHPARVVSNSTTSPYNYDLAILEFDTELDYPMAQIGNSLYLEVGEPVFAAGYPYRELDNSDKDSVVTAKSSELALKLGRIAVILDRALEDGYQIGYTNDVKKGMSGGPLLDSEGKVIGVNGKHAYPLWESPEIYQDGTEPCSALQELITRSSLAIPIEKSIELNPQLAGLKMPTKIEVSPKTNLLDEESQLIDRMQAEAQETAKSCRDSLSEVEKN